MSVWYEPIDRQRGRPPKISAPTSSTILYELSVLGGVLRDELFVPTARTRVVIRCDRNGEILVSIQEGRSSGV